MPRHELGSRFYIHTRNPFPPTVRPRGEANQVLIVLSHGYFKPNGGTVTVNGLGPTGRCAFLVVHGQDSGVQDVNNALQMLAANPAGNGGFWETPTNNGNDIAHNYYLVKGFSKDFKAQGDYRYVDTTYIDQIYPPDAQYDIVTIHNHFYAGGAVRLSDLFTALHNNLDRVYDRLYCGFCRELR